MYFMSTEVEAHTHLYVRPKKSVVPKPEMDIDAKLRAFSEYKRKQTDPDTDHPSSQEPVAESIEKSVPFQYNPLHDFESVLWLSLYLLVAVELKNIGDLSPCQQTAQHNLAYRLFDDLVFRKHVIQPGVLTKNLTGIHPRLTHIIKLLDTMRDCLTTAFYSAEEELSESVPFSAAMGIEEQWTSTMYKIMECLKKEDIIVEPRTITYPRVVQEVSANKRAAPRSDDNALGGYASERPRTN